MFQFSEKPLSVFQIYKQSLALYKNTFCRVWYVILINLAIVTVVNSLLSSKINVNPGIVTGVKAGAKAVSSMSAADGWFLVIGVVLSMYFMVVVIHRIYRLVTDAKSITIYSYFFVLRKLFFILVTGFITFLLIAIGFIVWIPGIFFMFLFAFYLAAILFEDKKVFGAIKRSCQLVWENWWHTFNVLVPIPIVTILLVFALGYVFKIAGLGWLPDWVFTGFFMLLNVFLTPLFIALYLVQYNDLKLRKEYKKESQPLSPLPL